MKKILLLALCFVLSIGMIACSQPASTPDGETQVLKGIGKGFGGEVAVEVTVEGDTITKVVVTEQNETPNFAKDALEQVPVKIVEANSSEVDIVSGATITSKAIMYAVNNALDPDTYPAPVEEEKVEKNPTSITAANVFQGFGIHNMGRLGPGKDNTGTGVYSLNQVFANVLFDGDGKILAIHVDQLEYATPNYDGDGMPHFTGFPGQSYNNDENHDEEVDGVIEATEETFLSEIDGWATKRERGDAYVMGAGTWAEQMDAFEEFFIGMTVDEVEEWFNKYTSDRNGRPLKDGSENEEDKAKYDALSDDEKAMLADLVSGATMSLNDPHGDIVGAIRNAYENRLALDIEAATAMGFGIHNMGRLGPGKDNTGTGVYSVNQVFAHTLFDQDGKIIAIHVDQLEYATPNYDGDGMPHFTGYPGQSYNNDENHDEEVDGVIEATEETFLSEIDGWATKRERGDAYVMGAGTWAKQMDAFQELFIGMTVDEVEEWFNKYASDLNGRPLKDGSDKPEDKAKYDALSADEKAMLADLVSSATMSLNDPHGDIVSAIKSSFDNRITIDLKVQ